MSASDFPVDMQSSPKSLFEKIGAALPIALTALATAFAGLSSSEMSRAMYWRSAAAQDQSKAADQWSLAAHKRDRSIMMQTTAIQLRATVNYKTFSLPSPDSTKEPLGVQARQWLDGNGPPAAKLPEISKPSVQAVLTAIQTAQPEADVLRLTRAISRDDIDYEIAAAHMEIDRLDREWDPVTKAIIAAIAARPLGPETTALHASQMEVEERRYRIEAGLNQQLGFLYEVRVKTSTLQSDRHRIRSEYFFYAMLAGQAGATLAALALARKHRSGLWLFAAFVGMVSLAFGGYVYLTM